MIKEFTSKEMKWILEFEKIVNKLPKTLELSVNYSVIDIFNKGARDESFSRAGDGDNIQNFAEKKYFIPTKNITPNGESI